MFAKRGKMGKFLELLVNEATSSKKVDDPEEFIVNLVPHVDGVTFCGQSKKDHEKAYKVFGTHRPARLSVLKNEHGMKIAHAAMAKSKGFEIKYHPPKD